MAATEGRRSDHQQTTGNVWGTERQASFHEGPLKEVNNGKESRTVPDFLSPSLKPPGSCRSNPADYLLKPAKVRIPEGDFQSINEHQTMKETKNQWHISLAANEGRPELPPLICD